MKKLRPSIRTLLLAGILLPMLLAFGYVVARSGPLAPVPVTVSEVETSPLSPALFGIGTVEAKYSYRIGPTITGHVWYLQAQVGDQVSAGQLLGEMDPVDMENRIAAKKAAIKRAEAALVAAEARVVDAAAREHYARTQVERYEKLRTAGTVSAQVADDKVQQYDIARASLAAARANQDAAREELAMLRSDHQGLLQQRTKLRLVSPVNGLVVARHVEPGSTVVAGQPVIEVIDPASVWISVRFDQLQSRGLALDLPAHIVLRSRAGESFTGHVERIEPLADAVTEEIMAKVVFDRLPAVLPPLGELAEVTVALPQMASKPVVPNASIRRVNGQTGVWLVVNEKPRYVPVQTGASDLEGRVQILSGLSAGDRVVVYSTQELTDRSRIRIVDKLVDDAT